MPTVQAVNSTETWTQVDARTLEDISPAIWGEVVRAVGSLRGVHLIIWDSKPKSQYLQHHCYNEWDIQALEIAIDRILEARGLKRIVEWRVAQLWKVEVLIDKPVWKEGERWNIGKLLETAFDNQVTVAWDWPPYKRTIPLAFPYAPTAETLEAVISTLAE